jgi:hypothetical protein
MSLKDHLEHLVMRISSLYAHGFGQFGFYFCYNKRYGLRSSERWIRQCLSQVPDE